MLCLLLNCFGCPRDRVLTSDGFQPSKGKRCLIEAKNIEIMKHASSKTREEFVTFQLQCYFSGFQVQSHPFGIYMNTVLTLLL